MEAESRMLTKLATFRGVSDQGEPLIHLFDPGIAMVKQAGEMMPQIQAWLDAYRPDPNKIAVLVNALGASEYWGQNVNGDIFPESALVHDCANHPGQQHPYDDFTGKIIPPYGAWTFMNAHPFVHHKNKDPNRAFGKVVLWAWNPKMHRVELIILLDKQLALQHGAQHVIDRILAGEFPDVSMGCKVPYDICSICGHKSKTRKDYCNCIRYIGMGKILDDGRKIGVINTYPRFFDISFVFIGADKTAKVMCKLGSSELWVPQSVLDAEELYGVANDDGVELVKSASVQVPSNLYITKTSEEPQKCLTRAAKLVKKDPSLKLMMGPPDKSYDTRHFWAETQDGKVIDPSRRNYTAYNKGKPLDLKKNPGVMKLAEPRIAGVPLAVSDKILAGRVDHQENPGRRAISDGTLKTNADVNDTDEFPEPLMPSRGKTASVKKLVQRVAPTALTLAGIAGGVALGMKAGPKLGRKIYKARMEKEKKSSAKQFILDSRTKTAAPKWMKDAFFKADSGFTKALGSPWGRAAAGGLVGGGVGAGVSEDRTMGGLTGASLGALGGLGLGYLGKRLGQKGGAKIVGKDLGAAQDALKQVEQAQANLTKKFEKADRKMIPNIEKGVAKGKDPDMLRQKWQDKFDKLNKKKEELAGKHQKLTAAAGNLAEQHAQYQRALGTIGAGLGSVAGGLGGAGLAGTAFHEKRAADGMSDLWEKCKKIKIGPPPKPNRKEYPFTGTIDFKGLMVHVENKPGTYREGKGWRTLMKMPYGEFMGTRGVDKDKLDVYVGPYRNAPNVYIIHQNKVRGPQEGKYDEDKVMLGFESLEQAKAAYLAHYDSDKYYRSATVMAFPLFKRAIMRKEVHGEKVASVEQSEYVSIMEKRAEDLRLEDLFSGGKTAGRRSKVWRHSDGRELKRTGSGMDDWDQVKLASKSKYAALDPQELLKVSAEKWADIVKEIGPDKAVGKVTPILSGSEPTIPKETLDTMAGEGLEKALATPSLMGMVLKPEEFQRIHLQCMGKGDLADKLDDAGAVFKPSEGEMAPCQELSADQLSPELMKLLMPLMGEKSYLGPVVRRRIIRITIMKPEPMTRSTEVNSPLLSKVASAYNWYRREQMKLAADTMEVVPNNPELHSGLYGIGDEDLFGKTAAPVPGGVDSATLAVVLGSIPISLMYSAHLRGERRQGKELGMLKNLVADHPWLATVGTAAGLRELMKSPQAKQLVKEVMRAGKRVIKGAPVPVA